MRKAMRRFVVLVVLVCWLCGGCAAVLVGGLIYKSTRTRAEKREFMQDFRHTNMEREKAGLEPLDLCREMYMFDRGWAWEYKECRYLFKQDTTATDSQ